tara:strand:+ start:823 stop:1164 length:342 start_codon:yes stop_codon:yes gene_type:complete
MTDLGLILTYILIGSTIILCVGSPILQIGNDISKVKKMLIPIFSLFFIIVFSVLISSNEVLDSYVNNQGALVSPSTSKIIGGCLISFYILSLTTILSIVYTEFLYKFFKNGKK